MVMVAVMPPPWVDNEADSLPDHNHESIASRVDVDSLEPTYGRKHEAPLPPGKPPPPPPPPPKTFAPLARLAAGKKVANGGGGPSCSRRCTQETNFETGMYAWSVTSSMYWKLLVVLELVLCLTDIVDDTQVLMYYQRVYILFLVSVAIVIITSLWIYLIYSKQPRETSSEQSLNSSDVEEGNFGSLHGTLKRAYIQRQALTTTNFHLRLGAVVFGIATLIYFGFEIAVHTTGGQLCADDIIFTLPIMLIVLCFLQIHFLFVNPQVLFGSMRGPAQFCFAHLLATDVSLWLKTVASQSASGWVNFLREATSANDNKSGSDGHLWSRESNGMLNIQTVGGLWWTTRVPAEFERLTTLNQCLRNTTLGQMWLQATPFLVPFLLQFCIVSSAVFYVLWSGMNHMTSRRRSPNHAPLSAPPSPYRGLHQSSSYPSNCHLENKGIFVGLLLLVGGVVVLVMYLILRAQPQFVHDSQWVVSGTICLMLVVQILATLMGFLRLQGTPYTRGVPPPSPLDDLLAGVTVVGPLLYSVLGLLVSASHLDTNAHLLVMAHCGLLLLQVSLQNVFVAERWHRLASRSGRQMLQILLFANAALWLLDTFMTASGDSQRLQEDFFGPLLWGLLAHVCTPLVALYRFHATVQLYELWKRSHT